MIYLQDCIDALQAHLAVHGNLPLYVDDDGQVLPLASFPVLLSDPRPWLGLPTRIEFRSYDLDPRFEERGI